MKNSSRIDETMPQNLTRSSSGSAARSSTRRTRSSCESSRFRKGGAAGTAATECFVFGDLTLECGIAPPAGDHRDDEHGYGEAVQDERGVVVPADVAEEHVDRD